MSSSSNDNLSFYERLTGARGFYDFLVEDKRWMLHEIVLAICKKLSDASSVPFTSKQKDTPQWFRCACGCDRKQNPCEHCGAKQ